MSTQLSFKSTVRRSSRLNPTFKKKLGFQKLEIEFISKSQKRSRVESKISPVLFDSPEELTEKSQKGNLSKLDVKFTKFSVKNGGQSENANSQTPITSSAYETTQSTDAVSRDSVGSSLDDIRKFINSGLNSLDFADEIKKFASEGLNSQNFSVEMKKLADEGLNSQDFVNAVKEFANDSLNSQDFVDAIEKFANDDPKEFANAIEKFVNDGLDSQDFSDETRKSANDGLSTQDLVDTMRKDVNEGLSSQDFANEITKFMDPSHSFQDVAAPCSQNIEAARVEAQTVLKSKPVRSQSRAPYNVCDGNILPESFRKSTARGSKKAAPLKCVTLTVPKSRNDEPVVPHKTNASLVTAKNLRPVAEPKKRRRPGSSTAAVPSKRKSRNPVSDRSSLFEPLEIEVVSQKAVPCETNVSFKPAKNRQSIAAEQKKERKPLPSVVAQSAKRKSRNSFPDMSTLLEPLNVGGVSQKTKHFQINSSLESAKNLEPLTEQKRGRKPRTSAAAKPAKSKSRSTFPNINSLFEPPQKTKLYSRKPEPKCPEKPVVIRRTRLSDKKKAALASAEMELCSLLSNCSVKSAEKTSVPDVGSKSEIFIPRQNFNGGTAAFANQSSFDLFKKDSDSPNTDDLSDFSDIFSMTLNVGNFSENLDVMSLLRQVTKIEKRLPHFVPHTQNWYENFEIW